jgi:hypothetical protein
VAVLLVGPALALLYRLDLTDMLAADHDKDLVEAPESPRSDPATLRTRGRENRAERPDSPRAQLRNGPHPTASATPGSSSQAALGGDAVEGLHCAGPSRDVFKNSPAWNDVHGDHNPDRFSRGDHDSSRCSCCDRVIAAPRDETPSLR